MAKIHALLLAILGVIVLTGLVSASITEVDVNSLDVNNENAFIAVGSTNSFEVYFTADNYDSDVQVRVKLNGQNINYEAVTPPFDVEFGNSYQKTLYITIPAQSTLDYGNETTVLIDIEGDNYQESKQFTVSVVKPNSGDSDGGGGPNPSSFNFCEYNNGSPNNPGDLYVAIRDVEVTDGFGENAEFYPLDNVEFKIKVENNGDYDVEDISLEWGIYDEDTREWIKNVAQDSNFDLTSGDDDTYVILFSLNESDLDINLSDLDNGDSYTIYSRITGKMSQGDFKGQKTCGWDYQDVEIRLDRSFVVLKNIVLDKETFVAGEEVNIGADVWNIGTRNQENVSVRIFNEELGINKEVLIGNVNVFENEKFSTKILIPFNTLEKFYIIQLEVLDINENVFENSNNDEAIFGVLLKVRLPTLEMEIMQPLNNSIVVGNSVTLIVNTNENAICKYGLGIIGPTYGGGSYPKEMSITGGTIHSQLIENLNPSAELERYFVSVSCMNQFKESKNAKVYFRVAEAPVSDTTAPIIILLDPDDNKDFETSNNDKTIAFGYTVSDESSISSCSLIIDNNVEETDSNVEKDTENLFRISLDSDESYDWRVECTDVYGNRGISETRGISIDRKSSSDGGGSSRIKILTTEPTNNGQPKKINFEALNFDSSPIDLGSEKPLQVKSIDSKVKIESWLIPMLIVGILFLLAMIVVFRRR
ncbi:MAG: putative S-layer protein [Nanoarchaeota archaeon]